MHKKIYFDTIEPGNCFYTTFRLKYIHSELYITTFSRKLEYRTPTPTAPFLALCTQKIIYRLDMSENILNLPPCRY